MKSLATKCHQGDRQSAESEACSYKTSLLLLFGRETKQKSVFVKYVMKERNNITRKSRRVKDLKLNSVIAALGWPSLNAKSRNKNNDQK